MDIKLPITIHNKFEIEVKDIRTGEIVRKAYAENIVLNNLKTSTYFCWTSLSNYFGLSIQYGKGTGTLSPTRTTLFNRIGGKIRTTVEFVFNQIPTPSTHTMKIVIAPEEHVGEIFTEVGVGRAAESTDIFTHALIKDSEGNLLTLGPKTNTQEITIYSTIYLVPIAPIGITFRNIENVGNLNFRNGILHGMLGINAVAIRHTFVGPPTDNILAKVVISGVGKRTVFAAPSNGVITHPTARLQTAEVNGKIKTFYIGPVAPESSTAYQYSALFDVNVETLAENNSTIWPGYAFDNTPIGIGTGSQTVFNLTWDEAWLTKPYKVYVDGIEVTSGFTFNAGNITFDTAPADQAVITADYWVKYIPKDSDHVLDIQFSITFGEGTP